MSDSSNAENYIAADNGAQESVAEVLSLEIQRDSRRYRADLSVGGD